MVLSHNMAYSSSLFFMQTIVADMRKVLAKNPQVEQQRLHRRVFLEDVNPENQALMVRPLFWPFMLLICLLFSFFGTINFCQVFIFYNITILYSHPTYKMT